MTNEHIKPSFILLSWIFSNFSESERSLNLLLSTRSSACLNPYKFLQLIKEIVTKRVNFKAIFSVAHALPHKFILQFCLRNLQVKFLYMNNSVKLEASTMSIFLLLRWNFLSHSNSISWRSLGCNIKMKCCSWS